MEVLYQLSYVGNGAEDGSRTRMSEGRRLLRSVRLLFATPAEVGVEGIEPSRA